MEVFFDNVLVKEIKETGIQAVSSDKQIKGEVTTVGGGGEHEMMFVPGDTVYFPQFEAVKFDKFFIVPQQFILARD